MWWILDTKKWSKKRGRLVTPSLRYVSSDKILFTGCSNSICAKKPHLLVIKNALLSHKNSICIFMRYGHLTYDSWILLKVTFMACIIMLQNQKIDESFTCTTSYILIVFIFYFLHTYFQISNQ